MQGYSEIADSQRPYVSVVVTARNDNHGGNLLRRMQIFVNALIAQARKHNLPLELILIEWNPPPEERRLCKAIQWPADFGPCTVRIIEVPSELHQRFKHAAELPLYQMIAKNVGIRRARGEFILATNIDIIFSEEFFGFLSERTLERGKMYRIDRFDVKPDVPVDAPVDEQLAYCKSHLLRLNAREGTFRVGPEGLRALFAEDIAAHDSGIYFGRGWFPPERHGGLLFRWVGNDAEVFVKCCSEETRTLVFDLEPGPGVRRQPFVLEVMDGSGAVICQVRIRKRALLRLNFRSNAGQMQTFRFRVIGEHFGSGQDLRVLSFRAFQCAWEKASSVSSRGQVVIDVREKRLSFRVTTVGLVRRLWQFVVQSVNVLIGLRSAKEPFRIGLPIPFGLLEKLQVQIGAAGLSLALDPNWLKRKSPRPESSQPPVIARSAKALHTNACGDFTLMAREHWLDLRGYPEFDLFSMNLDSVLCYTAHYGGATEEILEDPVRIYHIEHETGSGWTPEGQARLFERIAVKGLSWIDYFEVVTWANQMSRLESPILFNRCNWGFGYIDLAETCLPATPKETDASNG